MNEEELEYYLATKEGKDFVVYCSEPFKLSEIDLINLIKICVIEARSKIIGKKLLLVYRDSTQHREEITKSRLKMIGINDAIANPERTKNPKRR
jgi:hypothetical protein